MCLTGSVGHGGQNIAGDVLYVQILLADWLLIGGKPGIAIDGIIGNQTIAAIREFQKANIAVVDGLVERNRSTIKKLEERHIEALKNAIAVSPVVTTAQRVSRVWVGGRPVLNHQFFEAYLKRLRG
jgi:lysozyme family protein